MHSLRRLAMMAWRAGAALTLAVAAGCASQQAPADGYRVRKVIVVDPEAKAGTSPSVQLLEDARIQPSMRQAIGEAYAGDPCAADPPARVLARLCSEHPRRPLRPALVRLVDPSGRGIDSVAMERPLADVSIAYLYGDDTRPTFPVTVDLSAGFGSYSGPATRLADVRGGRLEWLTARDAATGKTDTITLATALKTAWRLVPAGGGRLDILQVLCRPDFDAPAGSDIAAQFILTFERYSWDGSRWVRYSRSEHGFWEFEGEETFPERTRFP